MSKTAMLVWNTMVHDARVTKEAQTLARHGHDVRVFCYTEGGGIAEHEIIEPGFSIHRVKRSPFRLIGTGKFIKRFLVFLDYLTTHIKFLHAVFKYSPEIIHSHDVNTLPTAWLAARLKRAKLVYDAHEISADREGYRKLRGIVFIIEKFLMPAMSSVITTTDMRAKYFARTYKRGRPSVLQNRPRRAAKIHREKSWLRQRLGIDDGLPIVLYQGGLQPGRGLELLVRTASRIEGAAFVLVGSGSLSGALSSMIAEMGLQERVFILPAVPLYQLPEITASADIGVQPIENTCLNHYTTDSNKLFEYLHAGLPVVASALPEIVRVVVPNRCGLVFEPGHSEGLRAALEKLLHDRQMMAELAENAGHAAELYCWENQEQVLLDIYSRNAGNVASSHE